MLDLASPLFTVILVLAALLALAAPAHAEDLPDFDKLWDFADVAGTETKFRALLPRAEAAKDTDYLAQLLTQIGRTEGLQGRFDDAHRTLDRAEKLLRDDAPLPRVRLLLERGRVFRSSKQPEKAKPLFLRAWDLGRAAALDGYACDAGHMLAITETGKPAIEWSLKTIAYAEGSKDPTAKRWVGTLAFNLGWAYHEQGEFEKALAMFRKDLAFRLERKAAPPARVAKWAVGRTLRSLGRLEEALATQRELEREFEALPEKDGYVFEEIAECLLAQKKDADAKPYFAKAYALLAGRAEAEGIDGRRLDRLRALGGVESK
jgi:tetratricopeptide (TPR) repeat protein